MANDWMVLVWLAILLFAMLVLKQWLNQHLQGISLLYSGDEQTAVLVYYLILLPGIILHELSHLLAATLSGVETRGFSLQPSTRSGNTIRMAAVTVKRSDPFRESWIGVAPLLTGSICILLLARWRLGIDPESITTLAQLGRIVLTSFGAADVWLWAYLVFAISNAMLPSESDRQPWAPVLIFLGSVTILLYFSGILRQALPSLAHFVVSAAGYLIVAFGLTTAVDAVFAVIIRVLEWLGERVLNRRVEY
jgi:hypothetical protein